MHRSKVQGALLALCRDFTSTGPYSSLELLVRHREQMVRVDSGVPHGALLDLASLSKVILVTAVVQASSVDQLDLQAPVFPDRFGPDGPTVDSLLRHLSGVRAWWPLYLEEGGVSTVQESDRALSSLCAARLWRHQTGVYSDLGYMLAARWIEVNSERDLWSFLRTHLEPLLGVDFDSALLGRGAGASLSPGRGGTQEHSTDLEWITCHADTAKEVELGSALGLDVPNLGAPAAGWPQDGNARWFKDMGLLGGHAGLFGRAEILDLVARVWLEALRTSRSPVVSYATRESKSWGVAARNALSPRQGRRLGWFLPTEGTSGSDLDSTSIGHTGFVGGSLWIDPSLDLILILLGHRRDPLVDLTPWRRRFHRSVLEALD